MTTIEAITSQTTEALEAILSTYANRHPGAKPLGGDETEFKYGIAAEIQSRRGDGWWTRYQRPIPRRWRGR